MNVKFVEEKQPKNYTEAQYIFRILRFLITWVAKEECECEEVMNFSQLLSCWYIPLRSVEKNRGCDFAQHVVYLILMYNIYKLYIWYFLKISKIENPAQRLFQKEFSNSALQLLLLQQRLSRFILVEWPCVRRVRTLLDSVVSQKGAKKPHRVVCLAMNHS